MAKERGRIEGRTCMRFEWQSFSTLSTVSLNRVLGYNLWVQNWYTWSTRSKSVAWVVSGSPVSLHVHPDKESEMGEKE
jgi:hypothetical protein